MLQFSYWHSVCLNDSKVYDIREATKKEALDKRKELGEHNYGNVRKVTVRFENAFDLLKQCTSEVGLHWEI